MKGKGMAYHGGKARVGKSGLKHFSREPKSVQTRTESSKRMGINYGNGSMTFNNNPSRDAYSYEG